MNRLSYGNQIFPGPACVHIAGNSHFVQLGLVHQISSGIETAGQCDQCTVIRTIIVDHVLVKAVNIKIILAQIHKEIAVCHKVTHPRRIQLNNIRTGAASQFRSHLFPL